MAPRQFLPDPPLSPGPEALLRGRGEAFHGRCTLLNGACTLLHGGRTAFHGRGETLFGRWTPLNMACQVSPSISKCLPTTVEERPSNSKWSTGPVECRPVVVKRPPPPAEELQPYFGEASGVFPPEAAAGARFFLDMVGTGSTRSLIKPRGVRFTDGVFWQF